MAAGTTISLGPAGEEWSYNRDLKAYDLSRGSSEVLCVGTTQGPGGTSITVSREASALVVVDMQNYFLSPEFRDHPLGLAAVKPTIKVIEKCREAGIQVIWLNWGLNPTDLASMPASVQRGFAHDLLLGTNNGHNGLGADLGGDKGDCLMAGSWNADIWPALKACTQPGDAFCAKNRMSGLWNPEQPLWKYLVGERKRTLFFAGVNTDQCVLGTLADAYNAGWDCVLIDDCCATTTECGKDVCLQNVANYYGFVVDSKSLVDGKILG